MVDVSPCICLNPQMSNTRSGHHAIYGLGRWTVGVVPPGNKRPLQGKAVMAGRMPWVGVGGHRESLHLLPILL